MSADVLTPDLIEEAASFLAGRVRRTPLEASPALAEILGVPVYLKLESLQVTGSFKARGALFRMSRLSAAERRRGVVTCSAGNHGMAVAWSARSMDAAARVYVPSGVDGSKLRGLELLGAEIVRSPFAGYDDTEEWSFEEEKGSGRTFLSAFDDPAVMAANGGTVAREVLGDRPEISTAVLPVGGGGLGAGLALELKSRSRSGEIVACQHAESPGLALSLERGVAVTRLPAIETAAGGLEGGVGALCFETLRDRVDRVALVAEEEILAAVGWMLDRHQYLVEPSAAVGVAACLSGAVGPLAGPTVVVLTGRNVSLGVVRRILES